MVELRAGYFRAHVANLIAASRKQLEPNMMISREAFTTAQWASQSAAAAAIQQMAARFASGQGPLADAVRKKQDLAAAWRTANQRLLTAISGADGKIDKPAVDAVRSEITRLEGEIATVNGQLEKDFPDYATLASPKPLSVEAVQKLLGPDEALVFLLPGDRETYLFALSSNGMSWKDIPVGEKDLGAKIAAFRRGLDVDDLQVSINAGRADLFDLGFAHELYQLLLGQVDGLIKDKRHLLVVPSGPLTGLPFHLLVTEKPAVALPEPKDLGVYRDAAWLIRRQAVSVLPSVASLQGLRVLAGKIEAPKPLIGFGDPVFRPETPPDPGARRGAVEPPQTKPAKNGKRVASKTRGYADYWRGAGADQAALGQSLQQLPDTADELKAVAKKVSAGANDVLLGRAATESAVKRARLTDYRIVYFATHGLVAGDIKGLAEPSLALSLPREPNTRGRRTAHRQRGGAAPPERRLGGALGLQHRGRRHAGCRSAVRPRTLVLLCRCASAPGVALGGGFQRGDAAHHVDLRSHQGRSQDRPRRGGAPRHAGVHAGPLRSAERLSGLLGTVLGDRRGRRPVRKPARCGALDQAGSAALAVPLAQGCLLADAALQRVFEFLAQLALAALLGLDAERAQHFLMTLDRPLGERASPRRLLLAQSGRHGSDVLLRDVEAFFLCLVLCGCHRAQGSEQQCSSKCRRDAHAIPLQLGRFSAENLPPAQLRRLSGKLEDTARVMRLQCRLRIRVSSRIRDFKVSSTFLPNSSFRHSSGSMLNARSSSS